MMTACWAFPWTNFRRLIEPSSPRLADVLITLKPDNTSWEKEKTPKASGKKLISETFRPSRERKDEKLLQHENLIRLDVSVIFTAEKFVELGRQKKILITLFTMVILPRAWKKLSEMNSGDDFVKKVGRRGEDKAFS